ncbi:MAG: DUF2441 domain-containing protein [Cytophagales bacterium]|nr:DUF2441 domain-containing protein [Cytophagales bacterium]
MSDRQVLYHVSNQDFAIDYFNENEVIDWSGDQFNQNTINLRGYRPQLAVADHSIDLIRALSSFGPELLDLGERKELITHVTDALTFTNRRLVENVFESIRVKHFSHLPSRAHSIYLTNRQHIRYWFQELNRVNPSVIYEFECEGTFHAADASWIPEQIVPSDDYTAQAFNYWNGKSHPGYPNPSTEILFVGKLRKLNSYSHPKELIADRPNYSQVLEFFANCLSTKYFPKANRGHDMDHTSRVMLNSLKLCSTLNLEYSEVIKALCAAFLHDLSRLHDSPCEIHGQLAVIQKLPQFYPTWLNLGLDDDAIEEIKAVVTLHCKKDNFHSDIPNIQLLKTLKDADALDRIRFGEESLDKNYLRLSASRNQIQWAKALFLRSIKTDNPSQFFLKEANKIIKTSG